MNESLTFSAAFMMGIFGSAHCLGMCGGISTSLTLNIPFGHGYWKNQLAYTLAYNSGRISSYCLAGLIVGVVGMSFSDHFAAIGYILRSIAGCLIIAMAFFIGNWWQGITRIEKAGLPIWNMISPYSKRLMPVRSALDAFKLGILWGWLPCGLVYTMLVWAAASTSVIHSTLIMLGFGLGTLPALFASSIFARTLTELLSGQYFRRVVAIMMMLFGLWTIPYIQQIVRTLFFGHHG